MDLALGLLYGCPVEDLIRLLIVSQHLLKFEVYLLMKVQELGVSDFKDALRILLTQDHLDLPIQVTNAHQVSILQAIIKLGQTIKQANVLSQFGPKLDCIAVCLDARTGSMSRLGELILTVRALSLEEGKDPGALEARLALLTRKVAAFNHRLHSVLPLVWCQITH
jgi:hypothetical protein